MTRASKRGIPEFIIQSRSPRLDMGREIPDTLFRWTPFLQERRVVAGLSMRFYLNSENRGVYSLFAIARLASEAESRIKGSSKAQPEDDKELLGAQCRWLRSFAGL
jgi:hypothetical protein